MGVEIFRARLGSTQPLIQRVWVSRE